MMSLRQTGTVAEYKAAHDVLAAQTELPMMQRLIYWEQGLKPEIRDECKFDPVTHTSYMDIAKAQSAAIAIDSHLTAAADKAAGKKRAGAPFSAAAITPRPSSKAKAGHIVQWSLDDGKFICQKNGAMAEPLPDFFQTFLDKCPLNPRGRKSLGKPYVKYPLEVGTCFAKGCKEPHFWHQCPTLAHRVFNEQVAKS